MATHSPIPPSTGGASRASNVDYRTPAELQPASAFGNEIVAKAGRYYRNTRYLMVLLFVGMGLWFAYDGFHKWPLERATELAKKERGEKFEKPRTETDILLQKALGVSLPPLGVALLIWTLYSSRGSYRLSGETLSVPGHPSITLNQITNIDKTLWDRKGIAVLSYVADKGQAGKMKLDDFVYERPPTDAIVDRAEKALAATTAAAQAETPTDNTTPEEE
jgi:hypothetical protein